MRRVEDLVPYMHRLVYATDGISGRAALTQMDAEGVGSLALVNGGGRRAVGVVRRKHLLRHYYETGSLPEKAKDKAQEQVPVVSMEDDISTAVEALRRGYCALVKGQDGIISHIVTDRVLANSWLDYAEPFRELELMEDVLRKLVAPLGSEAISRVARGGPDVEELFPRDYPDLIRAYWDDLNLARHDRDTVFQALVSSFVEFRNEVMHFRMQSEAREISQALRRLRSLRRMLEQCLGSTQQAH